VVCGPLFIEEGGGVKKVTIYSKDYCPYCVKAKRLFDSKGITYSEINLEGKIKEAEALFAKTGFRTVPQIFIGDECIGGCDDLYELDAEGKLMPLLNS
jgi:glutaredoxin 3